MEVRKNTGQVTTTMDTSHAATATATAGCNKDDPAFWLPTHFLTDDDFLAGVVDDCKLKKEQPKTSFDPFSKGGFVFESFEAMDSPVSSDGVDKDRENYDHELLAELTHQLARSTLRQTHHNYAPTEKPWMFSTSPQSTLSWQGPWLNRSGFSSNGSPNGPSQVPSPPVSPPGAKDGAAWELLYEAAGQIAGLKMNAMAAQLNRQRHHYQQQQQQNRGIVQNSSLCTKSPQMNGMYYVPTPNQHQQLKRQSGGPVHSNPMYCQHNHRHQSGGCGGALGVPQSAWPPARGAQPHHHNYRQQTGGSEMRAVFLGGPESVHGGGPAVKKQSTGTGVFLPRRVGTQPEPRKKPSGCSTVLLPARVVQALKLDLDEMNNGNNYNSHSRFGSGFFTDQDAVIARSGLVNQQRRSHDIRLPSDWTY